MPIAPKPKKKPWQEERIVQGRRAVDNSKFYNSRTWRKFRKQRLIEEPLCVHCDEKGITKEATVLDHIIRIAIGGDKLTKENTQPLCRSCHNSKSGKESHGYNQKK
jgi:5-methylcytosine-specific restriction protein A